MFTEKVFRLYGYQQEIAKSGKNKIFSCMLNKELPYDSRMKLDDMFYMISSDQVIDPESLKQFLRLDRADPDLATLKHNIDFIIDLAEDVIHGH